MPLIQQSGLGNKDIGYTGDKPLTFTGANIFNGHGSTVGGIAFDNATPMSFTLGVAAAPMILYQAAPVSISAVADNMTTLTSLSAAVSPAAAVSLACTTAYPSTTVAGAAHNFTVTAKDAFGNVATGYIRTIRLTGNDLKFTSASHTYSSTDQGVYTFSVALKTVGTWSITAADTVAPLLTTTQIGITVTPGGAASLAVADYPVTATAGDSHSFTVTARDAYNNPATGYTGTVAITSNDGQAVLPGNYTFLTGDNGLHDFNITLKTAGTRSITATDTATSSIAGTQSGITVTPGPAAGLAVSGIAAAIFGGDANTVNVTALDAFGNTATGYTGTVHFTSTDPAAALPDNYTFSGSDSGSHAFTNGVTFRTKGTQSVTATDNLTAIITGIEENIVVSIAPSVSTLGAGSVAATGATLNGLLTDNGTGPME